MRIETLHLERYGPFEDVTFDFRGGDVRLHVVFGPNEAGKSTVLAAIGDLLFGIPARTPYNFRHEYSKLRIGAEIVSSAGKVLAFKRRKANSATLLTPGPVETTLPDAVLAPFLGGVSREVFSRMFGLDHARLRQGGEQMLRSGGDLATSLFEAGSGLSGIGAVLQGLEAEIETIGDLDRRSKSKPIWREVETFVEAMHSVRRDGLKAEEWRLAEEALAKAEASRSRIEADLAELRRRRAQLERIRRVAPLLLAIDELAAQLAEHGELPALPAGFANTWRQGDQALREARLALQRAEEALRERADAVQQAPEAGAIGAFAEAIEALHENLGKYRKDVADEPKLGRDIAADDDLIRRQLQAIGSTADPAAVDALMPHATLVAMVRDLIRRGEGIEATSRSAAAELGKAEAARQVAEEALAKMPDSADPAAAAALAEEVAGLGNLAAQSAKAERDVKLADRDLAEALQRLPRWSDGADALATRSFPSADIVHLHDEQLRQAGERLAAATRAQAEREDDIRRVEAELAGLAAAGEVPSPAAVQAARDFRDRGWRVVRARHIEGREPAAEDQAAFEAKADATPRDELAWRDGLAARYETAVRHADALVDRRESDAQRIARFSELTAQRVRFASQRQVAANQTDAARQALAEAEEKWRGLWAESGIEPGPPAAMRGWLSRKDEVLRLLAAARQARAAIDDAASLCERAGATLHRAAQSLGLAVDASLALAIPLAIPSTIPLADLAQRVRQAIAAAERAWRNRQAAVQRVADEDSRLRDKRSACREAEAAAAAWREKWELKVVKLGLPADAGRPEAEAALAAWDEIRQRLTNRSQTVRRLDGINRNIAEFGAGLAQLVAGLGSDGAGLDALRDPEGTVRALVARLATARQDAARRSQAVAGHAAAIAAAERARRDLQAASDAAADLRNAHGLAEGADVPAIADKVEARRRCVGELEGKRRALADVCDGMAVEHVRHEVAATMPDAAVAELEALKGEETRLVSESQAEAQRQTSAQHGLDALVGRRSVAAVAQQARNAAQAANFQLQRWLRLTAAKSLLERALERYRAENQHPLVRRGAEIFTALAGTGLNPIVRLDIDYGDGSDPILIGIRRDGSPCRVEGMSEGTRDQLFLSLRIAAVEQQVHAGEPMPFVADDLFVTSDDERVVPGLAALAELGRSTQVILFTHHRHVAAAAAALPVTAVKLHRLPVLAAAEPARSLAV